MSGDTHQKITDALESQLQQEQDKLLDVIVELASDPAEPSTAPEMRAAFEKDVEPVSAAISRYGGEVVDSAWLNRTLRAKVPAVKVSELTDLREVAALDVPHRIERE
jgi:hypothetical protein